MKQAATITMMVASITKQVKLVLEESA